MEKFREILMSSDASDALLGEQIDALSARIDGCGKASLKSPDYNDLDKIPVNYMGRMALTAAISPSNAVLNAVGFCYGNDEGWRVIQISRVSTGETWLNYRFNDTWSGWKKITTT